MQLAYMTAAWVTVGMVIVWFAVVASMSDTAMRSFDARLISLTDSLVAATDIRDGHPFLLRPVSEPRFALPLSGYYYQIEAPHHVLLRSRSLWDETLPDGRFGDPRVVLREITGPRGQHLRLAERDIVPTGASDTVHVLVAITDEETLADIARMRDHLAIGFALMGMGVVLAVVLQVSICMRHLRGLKAAVADLREGRDFNTIRGLPSEVVPLVREIQALVLQNRETVERARNHVGNLAHALRTRLAVARNALDSGDVLAVTHEVAEAERLVQHHLARARAAALTHSAAVTVSLLDVADALALALRRLFAERDLTITAEGDPAISARCDRDDLMEMLGNLMENACKWARGRVRVAIACTENEASVMVSDDGPGLSADQLDPAIGRGIRMHEAEPGSGLGLAITADLAVLYGGRLELMSPGPDGGLAAMVFLPRGASLPDADRYRDRIAAALTSSVASASNERKLSSNRLVSDRAERS